MKSEPQWGENSTTDEVLKDIALQGRQVVVTGASSGLGEETVRALAVKGAKVILMARQEDKLLRVIEKIKSQYSDVQLTAVTVDLEDLESVRNAALSVKQIAPTIDVLINNAGLMACSQAYSKEGCERQFAVNHIGHFLLTCLLAPALCRSDAARIVMLTSGGHKFSAIDFDDLHFTHKPYDKWQAYGQSKTANALMAKAFGQRLERYGVTAFAVHPGTIATELGRHLSEEDINAMMLEVKRSGGTFRYKTVPQGAATSVWAATCPSLQGKTGLYLEDCGIANPVEVGHGEGGYYPYALDPIAADKLWAVSESIVGEAFDFAE